MASDQLLPPNTSAPEDFASSPSAVDEDVSMMDVDSNEDTKEQVVTGQPEEEDKTESRQEKNGQNEAQDKEANSSAVSAAGVLAADDAPNPPTKRNHTRTYQTLLTASKIRHLKKKDGEPLWRVDIQYDFLSYIFRNGQRVFTNSYDNTPGHTFADIYIDAMARSSKCSKILREKLLGDREAGLNMAMVCLLVNIGRMNTTLNFFPEMRAQLRTYHPIPSLQTYSDESDYKQLQDAPRLKSILKGACEDRPEPGTLEDMTANGRMPHTNPINLIFLLSTFAPRVQRQFFPADYEFFDLIMNKDLTSESRGRAFLWLVWTYLETNLTDEELEKNPFFKEFPGEDLSESSKHDIPPFAHLKPEDVAKENVDTKEEIDYGDAMKKVRSFYLEEGGSSATGSNRGLSRRKKSSGPAENGATKQVSDRRKSGNRLAKDLGSEAGSIGHRSPSPSKVRTVRVQKRMKEDMKELRCQEEIDRMMVKKDRQARRKRYQEGSVQQYWSRIQNLDPLYNSDDDISTSSTNAPKRRKKAAAATATADEEPKDSGADEQSISASLSNTNALIASGLDPPSKDYGEENNAILRALRRSYRWIHRWYDTDELGSEELPDEMPHSSRAVSEVAAE